MEQELSLLAQEEVTLTFVPHLIPMNRGILTTAHVEVRGRLLEEGIRQCYHDFYARETFVRICPPGVFPSTHEVRASNHCDIGVKLDERSARLIVVSAIDNLVKGASGQAVQNMNLMMGFDEGEGLKQAPLFP
jgi:N-acetyl-gamma-glutamyl-phosphate reductase